MKPGWNEHSAGFFFFGYYGLPSANCFLYYGCVHRNWFSLIDHQRVDVYLLDIQTGDCKIAKVDQDLGH